MANWKRMTACQVLRTAQVEKSFTELVFGVLKKALATLALIGVCINASHAQSNGATYVYDELDRLIQVIATNGSSTQYTYDAAGNIAAVKSDTVTTLAIASFYPSSANTGGQVTIYGSGFSTTATSNTVKFNGVSATVSAATATQLTVTVPTTATTGLIAVSNANGTVTSTQTFTVGSLTAPPTVTSFTPSIGAFGTVVAVTGTNFQTGSSNTDVYFNTIAGSSTSASSTTQIATTVSLLAQSGKVAVRTANGIGTSSADFFVVPTGIPVTSVISTARVVPNGASASLNISTAGLDGMLIFDGIAGQNLSLGLSSLTTNPSTGSTLQIQVYSPNGLLEDSCTLTALGGCNFSPLAYTGNYRIIINVDGSHTANLTFLLSSPITGTLVANAASPTIFSSTRVGQNGSPLCQTTCRVTF
ncbi:YD repeat-containing protein [Oxalobacteraceae bacterium GrIS 1.18]